ncbi:reverse transcriptase domain-containing protein [Tanacetum coccineum]
MSRSKNTRRILKRKFELEAFDITYKTRTSICGQILADFIAERPDEEGPSIEPEELRPPYQASLGRNTKNKIDKREGNPCRGRRGRVLLDDTIDRIPYERKSFLEPWLRYVGPTQAAYVVKEIHEGSCSMHSGLRSLVAKAIRSGYYWPTTHKDARNIIRKCDDCQTHRPVPKNPQQNITPITSPWPFYKWGINILGPFSEAQGKVRFLIITIDYFTKWIEAKPVATITGNQVKKFIWDNIVCMFRLPGEIISDNGNTKAMILVEIGMPSLRCTEINQPKNDEGLLLNLDVLEERREKAMVHKARSKAKMEKYYNAKFCSASFRPGDFVYRNNEESHAKESRKLGPKWEGPYEVVEALRKGAYKLRNGSRDLLPRTWNVQDLKKCYL